MRALHPPTRINIAIERERERLVSRPDGNGIMPYFLFDFRSIFVGSTIFFSVKILLWNFQDLSFDQNTTYFFFVCVFVPSSPLHCSAGNNSKCFWQRCWGVRAYDVLIRWPETELLLLATNVKALGGLGWYTIRQYPQPGRFMIKLCRWR